MNSIPLDPRLPQRIALTEQYLNLLNIRLTELFRSIAAQITLGSNGFLSAVKTTAASYTVGLQDQIILVNNTGNVTITLPNAKDTLNKVFVVKKISNNGFTVTIDADGGNVEGAATKVISTYLVSHELASDATDYWII